MTLLRSCLRAAAIPVALGVATAGALSAQATQSDRINTSGSQRGGGNIVSDAQKWWSSPTGHTDEFRTHTAHCRSLLDEAESHRQTSMEYFDQSRAPGISSQERTRLNRLHQQEYAIVSKLVRQFYECAHAAPSRTRRTTTPAREQPKQQPQQQPRRGDKIDTGGNPDRPQPVQPTPQQEPRRGDRIGTEGDRPGRPQPEQPGPQQQPRRGDKIDTGGNPDRPQPVQPGPQQQPTRVDRIDTGDRDCLPVPNPRLRAALRVEGNEALRTIAVCGAECDLYLTESGRLLAARLTHLSDPLPGLVQTAQSVPSLIRAASKAMARYMVNDNAANHRALLAQAQAAVAAADRALKQAARNPELTLARATNEILFARLTTGPARLCEATAVRVDVLTREIDEARKAVQIGRQIEERERAAARELQHMSYAAPRTAASEAAPTHGGVFKMLRENYGSEVFPELSSFAQKLQAAGVPRVLDKTGLESELRAAAAAGVEKPQGIVFIPRGNGPGHTVDAVWDNGRVVYKNRQAGSVGQTSFDAVNTFFYRVR